MKKNYVNFILFYSVMRTEYLFFPISLHYRPEVIGVWADICVGVCVCLQCMLRHLKKDCSSQDFQLVFFLVN